MSETWIVVPNWEKFQHYQDRQPTWIKVYTELAHKPEWEQLTPAQRGVLVTVWIEYALSKGRVSAEQVQLKCRTGAKHVHLKALSDAGFIKFRSRRPLELRYPREEVLRTSSKRAGKSSRAKKTIPAPADNNAEPPRDPDAVEKLQAIAAKIGRPL